jgi:hypothetical protein
MTEDAQDLADFVRKKLSAAPEHLEVCSTLQGLRESLWPDDHRSLAQVVSDWSCEAGFEVEIVERDRWEYFRFTDPIFGAGEPGELARANAGPS